MVERFWFWFLPLFVRVFLVIPRFDIGRTAGRVYNTRYTLVPTRIAMWFGRHAVFLHHFQNDDATLDFHNHPYDTSRAYVLAGGYFEERCYFNDPKRPSLFNMIGAAWMCFEAGDTNVIKAKTWHRVELIDKRRGCWTLFVAGEKVQPWGFWNRNTGVYT
jgi:hypothetical protein